MKMKSPAAMGLLVSALSTTLYAQDKSFPSRPVEIIVPSSPGGGVDLFFRLLGDELVKVMKAQVNVVNQTAGAGDVPTFAKLGYPQVNLLASLAFLAPKGLPETVAKTWTDSIRRAVQEPKLRESLKAKGYNIDLRTGAKELDKLLKEEIENYSRFSADELGWKGE